ncbi:50S ribosomal protein L20 [Candidatus Cyrtobacter comes]|uniref:Large ribosomal subunit protein bL20 n=1 Tax=Candidatus Cyrtobacter comes TaxID=675776 RepID=A0ABU5L9M7_9RICK|nr:50S ribosomal protein L20 [Candidatus Cyrtobacter comes]MDZ5762816.1 50S ribosomal protein L20 [Candidatus Cyrtobacter comes]
MARVKRGVAARKRHKKILEMASGYRGRSNSCFRVAVERVEKGLQYAYRDRRAKKREFRRLWIQRINAAVRELGMTYSQFINKISSSEFAQLNRKMLSEIAMNSPNVFSSIVSSVG